jgi:hypothetical protein
VYFFLLRLLALLLLTGTHSRLVSKPLQLSSEQITLINFQESYRNVGSVVSLSGGEMENGQFPVITVVESPRWLNIQISVDRRRISFGTESARSSPSTGVVRLFIGAQTRTITINRLDVGGYQPTGFAFNEAADLLYSFHQDTAVVTSRATSDLVAYHVFSPSFLGNEPIQGPTLSADGTEVEVYFPGTHTYARFDAITFALLGSVTLPAPPTGYDRSRALGAKHGGFLYLACHGEYKPEHLLVSYYSTAAMEVRSAQDRALLQVLPIPPLGAAPANSLRIEAVTPHPERDELWIAIRSYDGNRSEFDARSSLHLLRYALLPDGTIGPALAPPHLLTAESSYAGRGLNENRIGFLPSRHLIAYLGYLLDEVTLEPFFLPESAHDPSSYHLGFTPDHRFWINARGLIELDTGIRHSIFGFILDGVLSSDGRTLVYFYDGASRSIDLLATTLAQPANQVRTPLADQFVFPTDRLSWNRLPGATAYRVYLASDAASLSPAVPDSVWLLGEFTENEIILPSPLSGAKRYFWRIDPVSGADSLPGAVQSFAVSRVRAATPTLAAYTVFGSPNAPLAVEIQTSTPSDSWRVEASAPWLSFTSASSGQGPATVTLRIDATGLPVGSAQTNLTLHTPDGPIDLPLNLTVSRLSVQDFSLGGESPYAYAIVASSLVRFEVATGLVTHSRFLKQKADDLVIHKIGYTSFGDTLYVTEYQYGPRVNRSLLFAYSASNLEPLGELPLPSGTQQYPLELKPAPQGKLWLISDTQIGVLNPRTSEIISYPLPDAAGRQAKIFTSATEEMALQILRPESYGDAFSVRALTLLGPAWIAGVETDTPAGLSSTGVFPHLSASSDLSKLIVEHRLLDLNRRAVTDLSVSSPCIFLTPDSLVMHNSRQTFEGADLSISRILPSHSQVLSYHPPSGRVLYETADGLRSIPLADHPYTQPVTLRAMEVAVRGLNLEAAWPDMTAYDPGRGAPVAIEFRALGTTDWLMSRDYGYVSPMPLILGNNELLAPETDYEVRVRIGADHGLVSNWSNVVVARVGPDAPRHRDVPNYSADYVNAEEGVALSIPMKIIGNQLEWEVSGLPEGVVFDPVSRTLSGKPLAPGVYVAYFTVRNTGGQMAWQVAFTISAASLRSRTATYHGIQAYEVDPLIGDWRVTRTGKRFTGFIRTLVGTGSFTANLNIPGPNTTSEGRFIGGPFSTTIEGVRCQGYLGWDTLLDRCSLNISATHLFDSTTLEGSGYPGHYSTANPLPWAGRHTALLLPDPEPEDPIPPAEAPEGAGHLLIDLSPTGTARITGESAIGQKIAYSGLLDRNGTTPFFLPASATHFWGMLSSTAGVPSPTEGPAIQGALVWAKYENRKAPSYPNGFGQALLVAGSRLPPTGKKLPPLRPLANPSGQADLSLENGGLERLSKPVAQTLQTSDNAFIFPKPGTPENPNRVTVKLNPATGLVTGSAALLNSTGKKTLRTIQFRGVFVADPLADDEDVVGGYFTFPDAKGKLRSGSFQISEPETTPAP